MGYVFKFRQTAPLNYTFVFHFTPSLVFYNEKESDRRGTWYASAAANALTIEYEEIFSAVCILFVRIKEYFQNISPESFRHYLRGYGYTFVRRVREVIIFPVIRPRYFPSLPRSLVPLFSQPHEIFNVSRTL